MPWLLCTVLVTACNALLGFDEGERYPDGTTSSTGVAGGGGSGAGDCLDGLDNDGNGRADCEDAACEVLPAWSPPGERETGVRLAGIEVTPPASCAPSGASSPQGEVRSTGIVTICCAQTPD